MVEGCLKESAAEMEEERHDLSEGNTSGEIFVHKTLEDDKVLGRKADVLFEGGRGQRSTSTGASPAKMESCMFNFPIPTPRMWTIMVEPITRQVAGQPKLQHWRPSTVPTGVPTSDLDAECRVSSVSPVDDGPSTSAETSPMRKRNRIYLNGECIDQGTKNRKNNRTKMDKAGGRIFTFVADKRMPAPLDMRSSTSSSRLVCTKTRIESPTSSDTTHASPCKPNRRGRKNGMKPLTFHQLEFNSETLKPFDRSIFTVKNPDPSAKGNKPVSNLLVEAAEILLELQSDADSIVSVPIQTRNIPTVLDSPSAAATAVLTN